KSSAVVAPDRNRAPRGQSPVKRGLVIDPLMIGVPKRPSHRDRSHQNSAWHQKPRQLTCEAAIVRDMLQHLVAVHDIKLPRSWRDGTKPRPRVLPAKLFGLSYRGWRDIIALRCTSELLQPNGKDAIHTPVVEHLFAAGR